MPNQQDNTRTEFLKKNSPLKSKESELANVTPPPLVMNKMEENNSSNVEGSILGDKKEINEAQDKDWADKMMFWQNWNSKDYTYASLGLAVALIVYVGFSFVNTGAESPDLNATLTVGEQETQFEENNQSDVDSVQDDLVIEEEVVDSTAIIEDIENSPQDNPSEEPEDISDYIFNNYDL